MFTHPGMIALQAIEIDNSVVSLITDRQSAVGISFRKEKSLLSTLHMMCIRTPALRRRMARRGLASSSSTRAPPASTPPSTSPAPSCSASASPPPRSSTLTSTRSMGKSHLSKYSNIYLEFSSKPVKKEELQILQKTLENNLVHTSAARQAPLYLQCSQLRQLGKIL